MSSSAKRHELLNIVLLGDIVVPNAYRLHQKADFPFELVTVPDDTSAAEKTHALGSADAVVCVRFAEPVPDAARLRLIQLQSAGYDGIDFSCVPDQTTVCNAFGHTEAISEYALMTMLMWTHQWKAVEDSFRAGSWEFSGAVFGPLRHELNSRTVGILGYGKMGREIAARVRALGCQVLTCGRTPAPASEAEASFGLDELDEFMGACDFVVVCIAHVPETTGLIDAARLARMRRDAVLMNLARGPVVEEAALFDALQKGTIGGAILDVWWQYPDPENPDRRGSVLPFHTLPNVLMTPHSSGWTEQMMDRRWSMMVANLHALWHGKPYQNIVRPARLS